MTELEPIVVPIKGDASHVRREFAEVTRAAHGFGSAVSKAFEGAILRGRDFGDLMRSIALRLSSMAVSAAFRPIDQAFASLMQNLLGGATQSFGSPPSILPAPPLNIVPFARGGVIATPSYFPLASMGLAGERGAEAILPLARGADGRLGVRAQSGGRSTQVTVQVTTPDAASFRRSEAYLAGVIARAVARGERSL